MQKRNIRLRKEKRGRQRRERERKGEFGFDHLHLNACARFYPLPSANSALKLQLKSSSPLSQITIFSSVSVPFLFLILFCGKRLLLARSIRLFSYLNSCAALDWRSRGF